MSATTSIMSYRYSSSRVFPETPRIPSFLNLKRRLNTSSSNYRQGFTAIHVVFSGRINTNNKNGQRNFVVRSDQPGAPFPSGNSSNSWSRLILGMVLSIITPFWRHRCPLLALKNKVDMVVKTAEVVAVVVEKVAEEVEKIAKEVVKKLPEGGIKAAVSLVGNIAKETAKDAHIAEDVIHKVEEVETEVGSFFGSVPNKENETTKEGSESH